MELSLMAIVFKVAFGMLKLGEKISGVIGNFLLGGISLEIQLIFSFLRNYTFFFDSLKPCLNIS